MDPGDGSSTQVASGVIGEPVVESGDWRAQLQSDSRKKMVNKIIHTLERHLPFSGDERLQEVKRIAERYEAKIYTIATSQTDYSRTIAVKMLTLARSQDPMSDSDLSNSAANSVNPQGIS